MSQSPGRTVMPSVEITSAPGGTASTPTCPTAEMRSPSMRTTLLRIGLPPKPSTSVPPTSAFIVVVRWGGDDDRLALAQAPMMSPAEASRISAGTIHPERARWSDILVPPWNGHGSQ